MTSMTNEEAFAELYFTKKAIHDVLGITVNCWRPPYGDVDDRIRYVSARPVPCYSAQRRLTGCPLFPQLHRPQAEPNQHHLERRHRRLGLHRPRSRRHRAQLQRHHQQDRKQLVRHLRPHRAHP